MITMLNEWYWQDIEVTDSTNNVAYNLSNNLPANKCVISAQKQTQGRGRRGRSWISLDGNLFMSLVFKIKDKDICYLPFITSLALLQTVKNLSSDADIGLKWPNDVLLSGAKISGILLEKGLNDCIIIGIGVNIVSSPIESKQLIYKASCLKDCGIDISRCDFLQQYLKFFDKLLNIYHEQNFKPIRQMWLDNALFLNDKIVVNLSGKSISGVFESIDIDGALLLNCNGQIKKIYAGDVFKK